MPRTQRLRMRRLGVTPPIGNCAAQGLRRSRQKPQVRDRPDSSGRSWVNKRLVPGKSAATWNGVDRIVPGESQRVCGRVSRGNWSVQPAL